MTIINSNSIAGINSITAQASALNFYDSGGNQLKLSAEINPGTGTSISSPASNTLTLGTNDEERLRIDSSGDVGIGTDNPSKLLQVHSDSSSAILVTGATPQLRLNSNVGDGADADRVILGRASGDDQFISGSVDGDAILRCGTSKKVMIGYGTTEIAQFNSSGLKFKTSGMGIDFSATGDGSGTMTSELLDDYEEGEWTGAPTFGGGNTGLTGNFGGYYTKVGNMVTAYFRFQLTAKGSSTGQLQMTGLPYTAADGFLLINSGFGYMHRIAGAQTNGQMYVYVNGTTLEFQWAGYGSANTHNVEDDDCMDSTDIRGAVTYRVAT